MDRFRLFVMSFWMFFMLVFVLTIDIPIYLGNDFELLKISELLTASNVVAIVSMIFLIVGIFFYKELTNDLNGDYSLAKKIVSIENINSEYFALLVTIISLVAFDFKTVRGIIFLSILLLILYSIFVKTELFYSNPSFALLGFQIYKLKFEGESIEKIVITKSRLDVGMEIQTRKLSEKVLFNKS